jgi:hypothetical protein
MATTWLDRLRSVHRSQESLRIPKVQHLGVKVNPRQFSCQANPALCPVTTAPSPPPSLQPQTTASLSSRPAHIEGSFVPFRMIPRFKYCRINMSLASEQTSPQPSEVRLTPQGKTPVLLRSPYQFHSVTGAQNLPERRSKPGFKRLRTGLGQNTAQPAPVLVYVALPTPFPATRNSRRRPRLVGCSAPPAREGRTTRRKPNGQQQQDQGSSSHRHSQYVPSTDAGFRHKTHPDLAVHDPFSHPRHRTGHAD